MMLRMLFKFLRILDLCLINFRGRRIIGAKGSQITVQLMFLKMVMLFFMACFVSFLAWLFEQQNLLFSLNPPEIFIAILLPHKKRLSIPPILIVTDIFAVGTISLSLSLSLSLSQASYSVQFMGNKGHLIHQIALQSSV